MTITYADFLQNEAKLTQSSRTSNHLTQRFFELHTIPEAARDQIDRVEYETLSRAMRARWRALEADNKAKKLIARIEDENRKADAHAKILLGAAAIKLAHQDKHLRMNLLTLASAMPSANTDYLTMLLDGEAEKRQA